MKTFFDRLEALKSFSPEEMRFWMKIDVRSPEECWLWMGGTATPDGIYFNGRFGAIDAGGKRKTHVASRYAFKSFHGHWPEEQVLHSCDNGLCCNPWHLVDGTQSQNIKDAYARGRKVTSSGQARAAALARWSK